MMIANTKAAYRSTVRGAATLLAGLAVCAMSTSAIAATIPPVERNVLLSLYNDTNGPGWIVNTNWNGPPGTECSWYGVMCSTTCNAGVCRSNVISIYLNTNNLAGTIETIGLNKLQYLTDFEAYSNKISGSLPVLSGMVNLEIFDVDQNQFINAIPDLSGLANLITFSAADNSLSGEIPATLSTLTHLQIFQVNSNELSGLIPSLDALSVLETFDVGRNQLTGPMPSFASLIGPHDISQAAEMYIDVSSNRLSGPVGAAPAPYAYGPTVAHLCPNYLVLSPSAATNAAWNNYVWGTMPWNQGCTDLPTQTITFTSQPPYRPFANPGLGISGTYTLTATASSGLPVTFAVDPSSANVCRTSTQIPGAVTYFAPGLCTVNANQGGLGLYAPAPQAQQSFQVYVYFKRT